MSNKLGENPDKLKTSSKNERGEPLTITCKQNWRKRNSIQETMPNCSIKKKTKQNIIKKKMEVAGLHDTDLMFLMSFAPSTCLLLLLQRHSNDTPTTLQRHSNDALQ